MGDRQERTPLLDALTAYKNQAPAYFRIPGHRFERGISERWTKETGTGIFAYDLSEAEGLDDLHDPRGVIREAQELAAEAFGSERAYFLVNGTTCGNEAMVLASAWEGEKILVPRNAHKSILMGMIMSGAIPVWMEPELLENGLVGGISPETVERELAACPEAKAVFVVSPTYYGLCSDLRAIGEICHRKGVMLLVDEAHGAHLSFSPRLPEGALAQGADLCSQSIHKVTGSLTQSSLLHLQGQLADRHRVEESLRMVQSTSPSYLLMASLDAARYELAVRGESMMERAVCLADQARAEIRKIPGIFCPGRELEGSGGIRAVDPTRLILSAEELGISGFRLQELLYEKSKVTLELADHRYAVAVVTYANTEEEIARLIGGLRSLSGEREGRKKDGKERRFSVPVPPLPPQVLPPRQAWASPKEDVPWKEAVGRVAGQALAPYPPGIPVIYPGEVMTEEIWEYLEIFRKEGLPVHGAKEDFSVFSCVKA